ncbi:hypothetical protein FMM74_022035 [Lachnospiraceae bacterium MD308]|nr:hypothetical protein [Lachnospiraceae bacterium MD308]
MARRKKVEAKNYDELIKASEERIVVLTDDLKAEKANLKQLKKDKIVYDKVLEDEKKEKEIQEVAAIIAESGKTIEEIRNLLKITK